MPKLRCNHCGECCINPNLQIALTIGDIYRISKHFNKKPSELAKDGKIILNAFTTDDDDMMEYGFGLNVPCIFYEETSSNSSCGINKCTIYSSRPINCRLFPFWILSNAKSMLNQELYCMQEVDETLTGAYKSYSKKLIDILLSETRETEKFFDDSDFPRGVQLLKIGEEDCMKARDIRIKKALEMIDPKRLNGFWERLDKRIKDASFIKMIEMTRESL